MNCRNYQEILIDTGPLLQLLVGLYNPKKLEKIGSTETHFVLLLSFVRQYKERLITPHILAELSNLAKKDLKWDFPAFIKFATGFLHDLKEQQVAKDALIDSKNTKLLMDFGITDTAICLASIEKRLIITSDNPFFQYCYNNNIPVIHTEEIFTIK